MMSEGSCDTEDWSNDAENSNIFKYIYEIAQTFEWYRAVLLFK